MTPGAFLTIGLIAALLTVFTTLLGGDGDTELEFDMDSDLDIDFDGDVDLDGGGESISALSIAAQWVSIHALTAWLAGFGFFGWAAMLNNWTPTAYWSASIAAGFIAAAIVVHIVVPFIKQGDGDDLRQSSDYIGLQAEVVSNIPASGLGTIQFINRVGRVVNLTARSSDNQPIPTGSRVLVVMHELDSVIVDEIAL